MDQMVHLNQLIAHVLSFIVFFFLVRGAFLSIIYPPMKERRDRLAAEQARIEKEKADAIRLRQEYEDRMKGIEAESRARIHNAVTEGQQLAAEIREGARTEAQEMITRARDEITLERDKAQVSIKNEVVELAMAIATKVVQEELTVDRHKKLVDSFLAEVGQGR
jgi:F-type H+-transporting ATPase subunit b